MSSIAYITSTADKIDLSNRIIANTTVANTPAGATETTIASVSVPNGIAIQSGVLVRCTVNRLTTAGSTATALFTIKRGTTAIMTGGAVPVSATAEVGPFDVQTWDATPGSAPTYNITLTLASAGGAASNLVLCVVAIIV